MDITLCSGTGCELKEACQRHALYLKTGSTSKTIRHVYFAFVPYKTPTECDHFMEHPAIIKKDI